MVYQNSQLMPNFPPEGRGPTGVPIGQSLPTQKKKGYAKGLVLDKTGGGY